MNRYYENDVLPQLQQFDADHRQARRDRELVLAAEACHRRRILNRQRALDGERHGLEGLAEEWIQLLRDSSAKTAD